MWYNYKIITCSIMVDAKSPKSSGSVYSGNDAETLRNQEQREGEREEKETKEKTETLNATITSGYREKFSNDKQKVIFQALLTDGFNKPIEDKKAIILADKEYNLPINRGVISFNNDVSAWTNQIVIRVESKSKFFTIKLSDLPIHETEKGEAYREKIEKEKKNQRRDNSEDAEERREKEQAQAEPEAKLNLLKDQSGKRQISDSEINIELKVKLADRNTILPRRDCEVSIGLKDSEIMSTDEGGILIINRNIPLNTDYIEIHFPRSGNRLTISVKEIPNVSTVNSRRYETNKTREKGQIERQTNMQTLGGLYQKFLDRVRSRLKNVGNIPAMIAEIEELENRKKGIEGTEQKVKRYKSEQASGQYIPQTQIDSLGSVIAQKSSVEGALNQTRTQLDISNKDLAKRALLQEVENRWAGLITLPEPERHIDQFLLDAEKILPAAEFDHLKKQITELKTKLS